MNICYRIYNNMDRSGEERISDGELQDWIDYNTSYRPGCAQVVNGKVNYRGYLGVDQLKNIDPTITDKIKCVTVAEAVEVLRSNGVVNNKISKGIEAILTIVNKPV